MATAKKAAKAKKPKPLLQPLPESGSYEDGSSKFARALASNDYLTREKGLQALVRWMSRKDDVAFADMLKIWKSIFYCFWHSDKAPVQAELAKNLAAVPLQLSNKVAFTYFSAFVETMRREWFGIDRHRLDKYLMMVRTFYAHLFQLLSHHRWSLDLVKQYAGHVRSNVLLPTDTYRSLGFAYHTADVFVPELRKVAAESPPPAEVLQVLLAPFGEAMQKCKQEAAVKRYRESVFDEVKAEVLSPSDGAPFRHLPTQPLADALFQMGAEVGVKSCCREELYELSNAFEKAAAKRAKKAGKETKQAGGKAGGTAVPMAVDAQAGGNGVIGNGVDTGAAAAAAAVAGATPASSSKKKRKAGKDTPEPSPKPQEIPLLTPPASSPSTSERTPASGSKRKAAAAAAVGSAPSASTPQQKAQPTPSSPAATPTGLAPSSTKPARSSRLSKVSFSTPNPTLPPPSNLTGPSPNGSAASGSDGSEAGTPGPAGHTPFSSGRGQKGGKGKKGREEVDEGKDAAANLSSKGKRKQKVVGFNATTEAIPGAAADGAGATTPSPSAPGAGIDQSTAGQTPFSASTGKRHKKKAAHQDEGMSTPEPTKLNGDGDHTPLSAAAQNGTRGKKSTGKKGTGGKGIDETNKKNVVINLRKNLYFAPGSPAPQHASPAAPKGILKKTGNTPNSAPSKTAAGSNKGNGASPRRFLTPTARPRPKAASFFS